MALDPSPEAIGRADSPSDRLDSWKQVAAYLNRDVSTVQRWERKEGLPVHRHLHDKLGSIYAFRHELDAWQRGRGPQLERLDAGPAGEIAVGSPAPSPTDPSLTPVDAEPTRTPVRRWRWQPVAGGLAVAAAALVLGLARSRAGPPQPRITSLAVLPLEYVSIDPARAYLAGGLTDEVTARLAQLSSLRVASRTSAAAFERRSVALPVIARELGIDAALEGTVRDENGRVAISVRLLDARTDALLWSREFDRDAAELMQLPQDVARAVAVQLRVPINETAGKLPARAVDRRAQEEYLLGRYLLWKVTNEDDRRRAIEHFERAISISPDYAAPYAGLAHAWWMRGVIGQFPLHEVTSPARDAARKALALDDRLAEAYAAEAYVQGMFDWDWTGAEKTIQRAVALEPNSVDSHYVHALLLMAMGSLPDALVSIERAAELDPLSAQVQSTFGRILYRARRFDDAVGRLRRAIELEPRNAMAYGRLADVYSLTGRLQEALQLYEKAGELSGGTGARYHGRIACAYVRMGREPDARRLLSTLNVRSASAVHTALGEVDEAFALLFGEIETQEEGLLFIKTDPDYDRLHDDPRWRSLLDRMRLG